jgi:hypothetical protein
MRCVPVTVKLGYRSVCCSESDSSFTARVQGQVPSRRERSAGRGRITSTSLLRCYASDALLVTAGAP